MKITGKPVTHGSGVARIWKYSSRGGALAKAGTLAYKLIRGPGQGSSGVHGGSYWTGSGGKTLNPIRRHF